jgi:hypothetical protein
VPFVLLMFLCGTVAVWFILGNALKVGATRLVKPRAILLAFLLLASVLLVGYGTRAARVRGQSISVRSKFSIAFRHYAVGDIESYAVEFIKARRSTSGTYLLTLRFRDGTTAELNHRMKNYDRLRQFLGENHVPRR